MSAQVRAGGADDVQQPVRPFSHAVTCSSPRRLRTRSNLSARTGDLLRPACRDNASGGRAMHDGTPPEDQAAAFAQLAATLRSKARAKPEKPAKAGPRLRVIKESIKVESNDEATTHKLMSYKPLERELP